MNTILVNAYPNQGRKVMTLPELVHGAVGTWQYMFSGKMRSLPVTLVHFQRTTVDYITFGNDEFPNTGCIVMKDMSGDMYEVVYQIIRDTVSL
jgi:hypothetical protein